MNVLLGDGSGGNLRESSISINFIQLAGTGGVGGKKQYVENVADVCIYNWRLDWIWIVAFVQMIKIVQHEHSNLNSILLI